MASLPTISSPSSARPFLTHPCRRRTRHPMRVSCQSDRPTVDRRELLLGLGGAYAASLAPDALSLPVQPPDLTKCRPGTSTNPACCPPFTPTIVDFTFDSTSKIRVRPAAHLVDEAYLAKYKRAVELMRALPADDPRSFVQQANVHCAYCSNSYDQVGFPNLKIQVHNCWLFFPFHRLYLHFHERILGSLIGDENFALPFWNWDSPAGMSFPRIFADRNSSLYNALRLPQHLPPATVDFNVADQIVDPNAVIQQNLSIMYRQMVSSARTTGLFMGQPFRAGSQPGPGAGSIEGTPHGTVHSWVGRDMSAFSSAARDPVFYSHHANVDRMWAIWKTLDPRNVDFVDPDWLETAFLFYDENKQLVRVKVKDCLTTEQLGFVYQEVDVPWINSRPTPRGSSSTSLQSFAQKSARKQKRSSKLKAVKKVTFPLTLSSPVRVAVKRKVSKLLTEQERERETLNVEGIELDGDDFVKFDVYVDDDDEGGVTPSDSEFAGSFVNVPLRNHEGMEMKLRTALCLGIADLIEDLGLEDEEKLLVTIVPREGKGKVNIGGVRVEIAS